MNRSPSFFITSGVILAFALLGFAACAPAPTPTPPPTTAPTPAPTNALSAALGYTGVPGGAANAAVKLARVQGFGIYLTDNANRTLYAFDKDTKDTSTCTGNCLTNWLPFTSQTVPQGPANLNTLLTVFTRADGTSQVEFDGRPLYYYSGDQQPGDVKGQNVGNAWHVLSPRGSPMMNPFAPAATATP